MSDKADKQTESRRFWFGAVIAMSGVAMLFVAMFIPPKGEISGTILGAAGEMFVLAGSMLGLDGYVSYKMKRYINDKDKEQ